MPKYIEKDNLPQFKYYNFCEGEHDNWGDESNPSVTYHISNGDIHFGDTLNEDDIWAIKEELHAAARGTLSNDDSWKSIREKWVNEITELKGKRYSFLSYIYALILAAHKDRHIAAKWKERIDQNIDELYNGGFNSLIRFLLILDECLSFASALRACQGFPIKLTNSFVYPKMLLIDSKFYNKIKDSEVVLDYDLISEGINDSCYTVIINGESAEKKMCFCLIKDGDNITLEMLDRNNGLSAFVIKPIAEFGDRLNEFVRNKGSNGNTLFTPFLLRCHPRGDYECFGDEEHTAENPYCFYCDGKHNCKHKMLNIVAAVFYCFQEYVRKTKSYKTSDNNKVGFGQSDEIKSKPFVPSGMIRMYDIKYSAEELARINKYANFGSDKTPYTSTEKSPHVRRGTMRFNPKTGQKDIVVRGSIIHKDRYEGFSTAERIKE